MKLLLCCNLAHRAGYLNADPAETAAADLCCEPEHLPFRAGVFEEVRLGRPQPGVRLASPVQVLVELHRVLRPSGMLVIEALDPSHVHRCLLGSGDPESTAALLEAVFADHAAGTAWMPVADGPRLESALDCTGFRLAPEMGFLTSSIQPGETRFVAARRRDEPSYSLIGELRRSLGCLAPGGSDYEVEERFFQPVLALFSGQGDATAISRELLLVFPRGTHRLCRIAASRGIHLRIPLADLSDRAAFLDQAGWDALLIWAMDELARGRPELQGDVYLAVMRKARRLIEELWTLPRVSWVARLREVFPKPREGETIPAGYPFTRRRAALHFQRICARGVRHLARGELRAAEELLSRAACSRLCALLSLWNLAILRSVQGDTAGAVRHFREALALRAPGTRPLLEAGLGACLLHLGETESLLELASGSSDNAELLFLSAVALIRSEQADLAAEALQTLRDRKWRADRLRPLLDASGRVAENAGTLPLPPLPAEPVPQWTREREDARRV